MNTYSDENKPVRMAFDVTQGRVEHYSDVISYMVKAEVSRCQTEEHFTPSAEQIRFYEKELIRHMTIRRNIEGAQKIRISKSNLLLT